MQSNEGRAPLHLCFEQSDADNYELSLTWMMNLDENIISGFLHTMNALKTTGVYNLHAQCIMHDIYFIDISYDLTRFECTCTPFASLYYIQISQPVILSTEQ